MLATNMRRIGYELLTLSVALMLLWASGWWNHLLVIVGVGLAGAALYIIGAGCSVFLKIVFSLGLAGLVLSPVYVAYPLIIVALQIWLASRISTVPDWWLITALRNCTVYVGLAGMCYVLSTTGVYAAFFLNPLLLVMVSAHFYKPLSEPDASKTLSRHWAAFSALMLLGALGVPGFLLTFPPMIPLYTETDLWLVGGHGVLFAAMSIVLAVANQAAAEMRGTNRRVTGLLPFWTITGGLLGWLLARSSIGLVQLYGRWFFDIPPEFLHRSVLPLVGLAGLSRTVVGIGLGIYLLTFVLRRP